MRLGTTTDGRAVRIENERAFMLPGALTDHLLREATEGTPVDLDSISLGPPVPRPGKIVCVGLNYADHAAETGMELPEAPMLFNKLNTCVVGPGHPIVIPAGEVKVDHEAELAVIIGRACRDVSVDQAAGVIGGYSCFNDVSERVAQRSDGQFLRGKSFDTFGPLGPHVVTPDEAGDPGALGIRCVVNGEVRQESSTSELIFSVNELISYCSRHFPLEPGDVIATGTPGGVGAGSGRFLAPGDEVTIEIERIGSLTNPVVGPA